MQYRVQKTFLLILLLIFIMSLTITGYADDETPPPGENEGGRSPDRLVPGAFRYPIPGESPENGTPEIVTPNVVGGSEVTPENAYPWVVSLQYVAELNPEPHYCGGVLIDAEWVLTAAHCWVDPNGVVYPITADDKIVLGEHSLWTDSGREQVKGIAEVIIHPAYIPASPDNPDEYDFALLRLSSPATLNSYVQPIQLSNAATANLVGMPSKVIGWGDTSYGGSGSDVLLYADITILADTACSGYVNEGTPMFDSNSMLCAGTVDGSKDACQGDSGGPLAYQDGGVWKLAGLVSWGPVGCGVEGFPGVYARVPHVGGWIRSYIDGTQFDFDGDRAADAAVYRPSSGMWFIKDIDYFGYGLSTDIPVPGDYDGDGDMDAALYRPSSGMWFIKDQTYFAYGISGDIPVPGDYDGDGDTDAAVYRPSLGMWFIKDQTYFGYGLSTDIPVPGDYDGDGDTDPAVYRPSSGMWFIKDIDYFAYGLSTDIPVPGDYDGDGDTDPALYRPSSGMWFIKDIAYFGYGLSADIPVPADYDGDGDTDPAVYRPSSGMWFIKDIDYFAYGLSTDYPIPARDTNGDGDPYQ